MKATDLQVGDWVLFVDDESDFKQAVKVEGIDPEGNIYTWNVDENMTPSNAWCAAECFDPIPITEEMLEKNTKKVEGFTCWLYWLDVNEQCYVRKYNDEYTFMYKRGFADACIPIEFVHQLQHCLKMFGISKEIVL